MQSRDVGGAVAYHQVRLPAIKVGDDGAGDRLACDVALTRCGKWWL